MRRRRCLCCNRALKTRPELALAVGRAPVREAALLAYSQLCGFCSSPCHLSGPSQRYRRWPAPAGFPSWEPKQ
jgi:hypothetical protein